MSSGNSRLLAVLLGGFIGAGFSTGALSDEATSIIDTRAPGADLPARGQSLFDFLCSESDNKVPAQQVPFPFPALLARLQKRMGLAPGSTVPYAAVLIPLGRSLQRHAAAPNFFHSPRVVVAMLGESVGVGAPLLKERLYMGYQEQAGVLEVISYNEAMGRFEFQLVKDYKAGATPRVYYAKRAICVACHQNQAPLFSRPLWRETNANPAIAARLLIEHRNFYGVRVPISEDVPNAIDAAIQRANRYSLVQWLWITGCATSQNAAACRAELTAAALQLRLSGGRAYESTRLDTIRGAWQTRWPHGLSLPDSNIPNRDPLAEGPAAATPREMRVPASLDPLLPRAAVSAARFYNSSDQDALIADIGAFFSAADIDQLDKLLYLRGQSVAQRSYTAQCRFSRTAAASRLSVQCKSDVPPAIAVEGRLYFEGMRLRRGVFDRIAVQDDVLDDVNVVNTTEVSATPTGMTFALQRNGLHARRRSGNALTYLRLQWSASAWRTQNFVGELSINEQADFAPLQEALRRVAAQTQAGSSTVFAAQALNRATLMPALRAQLRMAADNYCCVDNAGLPQPRLEDSTTLDAATLRSLAPPRAAALQTLQRFCAPCHDSAEKFPPNFLSGDLATVQSKLTHCAARIDYRLSMWALAPAHRAKTPMPPELALRAELRDPAQWRYNPAYLQLRQYLSTLRGPQAVAPPRDYAQLDTCLPNEE